MCVCKDLLIAGSVKEEVDLAVRRHINCMNWDSFSEEMQPPDSKNLQLQFSESISLPVFTGSRIEGDQGTAMKVTLVDAVSGQVVTRVRTSSANVEIVVLEGDFGSFVIKNYVVDKPATLNMLNWFNIDKDWRLEKISKDGAFHKRLSAENVKTVKDFLTLLFLDPQSYVIYGALLLPCLSMFSQALAEMKSINLFGVHQICRNSIALEQAIYSQERSKILLDIADALQANEKQILTENEADVAAAQVAGYEKSLISRLAMKPEKVANLAKAIRVLANMEEPIGRVLTKTEEKSAVHELRQKFIDKDLFPARHDEYHTLLRFLKTRDFDFEKISQMWEEMLKWRHEYGTDSYWR
ncbi:hypothetical protein POM88_049776 [Heracleum sosnowskyi]|uniref:CRAL/TRIO N-terminal domain-containing protein n=1 Tax=Heracleum sosnowskyi TaxID=360622 RepID=A0AAD8LZS1_9APIA|nr:hypothetical protein POM88_049776 [Heracleum sosnowskyi]